jgi:hypothetical protein
MASWHQKYRIKLLQLSGDYLLAMNALPQSFSDALEVVVKHSNTLCFLFAKLNRHLHSLAKSRIASLIRDSTGHSTIKLHPLSVAKQLLLVKLRFETQHLMPNDLSWFPDIAVQQISTGIDHVLFLTSDNLPFACGNSADGRLGFAGNGTWEFTPRMIMRELCLKVCAGSRHSLLLSETGNAFSFGFGRGGRLGHGLQATCVYAPTVVNLPGPVVDCAAGSQHSAFVTAGGKVYTCGMGGDGRLGTGHKRGYEPSEVKFEEFRVQIVAVACALPHQIECGGHTLFLAADGRAYGCGSCGNARLGVRLRVHDRLGFNSFSRSCYSHSGHLRSVDVMTPLPLPVAAVVTVIAAGRDSSAFLTASGRVCTFGVSRRENCRPRAAWAVGVPPACVLQKALAEDRVRCRGTPDQLERMLRATILPEVPHWEEPALENGEGASVGVSVESIGYGWSSADPEPVLLATTASAGTVTLAPSKREDTLAAPRSAGSGQ